jgi:lipid-binding SYLF domain-containing protein
VAPWWLPAEASQPISIERNAEASLKRLYAKEPAAKTIAEKAKVILLFPNVLKAGFLSWGLLWARACFVDSRRS